MHKCTDGYIFIEDKEMSWNEPYYGWRRINVNYCPICGFAMQPERSKREDYFELCALCEQKFTPSDWQNDVCDKCLYKK